MKLNRADPPFAIVIVGGGAAGCALAARAASAAPDAKVLLLEAGPDVVGTCAMGPSPADGAVVDAEGGVHGTRGLHIVDASIIPTEPSGFTLLPTIMLAERMAPAIAARAAAGS